MSKLYSTVLLLFLSFSGVAQSIPFIHLTTKDGLPSNTVYSLYTDSKGYLWVPTDKGLARYNGIKFEIFTTSDGLPDNEVFSLREDFQGRLWIATFKGDLSFYKDGIFHTSANTPWLKLKLDNPNFIHRIRLERDSSLLFVSTDGNTFAEVRNNAVKILSLKKIKENRFNPRPHYVRKVNKNQFQVFYETGSVILDSNANLIQKLAYKNGNTVSLGNSPKEEYLYFNDGLHDLNDNLILIFGKNLNDSTNHGIYFNRQDHYFVSTNEGLLYKNQFLLKENALTYVEGDVSDNVWATTRKNGVYCISKNIDHISIYNNVYKENVLLAKNIDNTLFFVTATGDYYKLEGNRGKLLFRNTIPQNKLSFLTKSNFLITDNGSLVFQFGEMNWFLKNRQDKDAPLQKIVFKKSMSLTTKDVCRSGNDLIISSISTIARVDYAGILKGQYNEKILVSAKNDNDNRIFSRAVNPADLSIWFSRADGIFKIEDSIPIRRPQFKNQIFRQFLFLGNYLIGFTASNKLLVCSQYTQQVIIDSIVQTNCIWENIYPIDNHRAIISTNNYHRLLTLYPPSKNGKPRYSIQTIEDPFVPTQAEYITADSNNCYFFKEGTITRVATPVLFEKTSPPVPVFSSFKALDKPYLIRPEIKISYDQSKSINITFDNISFVGKNITCQYSISDNEKDEWREITGNEINLNTPGYGTYLIKIRSKTLSSGYSKPAVIKLIVQKPFWATWWFISLCALALIAIVWGIIVFITWRKLRKKQKEHDADMKYQQSEYKALNALMNPHFIFNSLNNIQGLINKDEKRIANEYLVIFSDLVRQNMHNISKGFISLQQELTLIENYLTLEKLRFKDLVNYEIKVEEEVDIDDIMVPPLMIQPLVENAVKHGLLPKQSALSKVSVHVYEKDNLLYIVIEDNGVGLTQSLQSENKLHESFGLSNLQKRTEHLKKIQQHEINIEVMELKNSDGSVKGTQAVVTIKLIEA
jgi:two-component sensor histidine kinase/outer membrane protein assembly factor BamB